MKKLVVFTGAGVSRESGLKTFRDDDGLWENYSVEEVATIDAWYKNPKLVLDFYNARRRQVIEAQPNIAHLELAKLESFFDVQIVTQNIDNLHERAGSSNVLHLHGMIDVAKSSKTGKQLILNGKDIQIGDYCEAGHQLRPDIVWFGEDVPNMEIASEIVSKADLFLIIGTSLNVYPAAGLVHVAPDRVPKFLVDPNLQRVNNIKNLSVISKNATEGVPMVAEKIIQLASF
jgi:NAD-dependent deacetylase